MTVGKAAGIIAFVIICAWLYLLTARFMLMLDRVEQIIDRDHGPTLPPDVRPEPARNEPPQPVAVHVTDQATDPGQVPDVLPDTDELPIVRPLPTQPQAAVLLAHWAADVDDFQARQDLWLHEAQERIRMIAEGAA